MSIPGVAYFAEGEHRCSRSQAFPRGKPRESALASSFALGQGRDNKRIADLWRSLGQIARFSRSSPCPLEGAKGLHEMHARPHPYLGIDLKVSVVLRKSMQGLVVAIRARALEALLEVGVGLQSEARRFDCV